MHKFLNAVCILIINLNMKMLLKSQNKHYHHISYVKFFANINTNLNYSKFILALQEVIPDSQKKVEAEKNNGKVRYNFILYS